VATSVKNKTSGRSAKRETSAAGERQSVTEAKSAQIASLRLNDFERVDGTFGRRLRLLLLLAILGGLGYAVYAQYGDQGAISVDAMRARASAIWNTPEQSSEISDATEVDSYRIPDPLGEDVFLSLAGFILPEREIRVGPRVPGTIVDVPVEQGTRVEKGDLLAKIESTSFFAELEQSRAMLALAEANLEELQNGSRPEEIEEARAAVDEAAAQLVLRKKERDRILRLRNVRNNVVSQSEFDVAESEFKRTEAQVRSLTQKLKLVEKGPRPEKIAAAKARVDEARARVTAAQYFHDNSSIVSPIDGTVLEKRTEVGEIMRPDVLLSEMFLLADLTKLQAEVEVQERDLHRVSIGNACRIIPDAYPDRRYAGRIVKIKPQINRQRAVAGVKVAIAGPDEFLLPNMNCRVEFLSEHSAEDVASTVRVPVSALIREGEESLVYTLEGTSARRRRVECGGTTDAWVEIQSGLAYGDVVLLPGEDGLHEGQQVFARSASPDASAPQPDGANQ